MLIWRIYPPLCELHAYGASCSTLALCPPWSGNSPACEFSFYYNLDLGTHFLDISAQIIYWPFSWHACITHLPALHHNGVEWVGWIYEYPQHWCLCNCLLLADWAVSCALWLLLFSASLHLCLLTPPCMHWHAFNSLYWICYSSVCC